MIPSVNRPAFSAAVLSLVSSLTLLPPAASAKGNVDIGRGVDVLQQFGITGDVLYGDVSKSDSDGVVVTHDILEGADRFT